MTAPVYPTLEIIMRMATLTWILLLTALTAFVGCGSDDSPTGPEGAVSPDRLVIVGHHIIPIDRGEASFRAYAQSTDGSETDVTDQVIWTSDDESVFTVDGGQITILQGGLAHIRARLGDTDAKLNLSLVRRASGVRLPLISGAEHMPDIGQSVQLIATMGFPGQFDVDVTQDVYWESSDPSILRVDIHGVVTAVGNGEAYVTARYGMAPGTLNIVAGPLPLKTYDVTVIAIRLDADQFCEAADEGDAEFSYEISLTTSEGERYVVAATDDYPSSESFVFMENGEGSTGLLNIEGEAAFVLSEVQSFKLDVRITEWDHEFAYFGEWIPDPEADDLRVQATHRASSNFDEGTHALAMVSSGGNCDLRFEYRVVVTER